MTITWHRNPNWMEGYYARRTVGNQPGVVVATVVQHAPHEHWNFTVGSSVGWEPTLEEAKRVVHEQLEKR